MKRFLLNTIRFILIIIIIVCLSIIGKRVYDGYMNHKNNQKITSVIDEVSIDYKDNLSEFKQKEVKNLKILQKFHDQNSDVVGFIEVEGTDIKYPILHYSDNDYYLRLSIDKEYDLGGSIFLEAENDKEFNDDNSVIYGHHMGFGMNTMFTQLEKFRDQSFADKNNTIYITTFDGLRKYKIFSSYVVDASYDYRTLSFESVDKKLEYFNKLRDKSDISYPKINFQPEDKIITLSTCQWDYDNERLAVHALRVSDE